MPIQPSTSEPNSDHDLPETACRRLVRGGRGVPWLLHPTTWRFSWVGPQAEPLLGYPRAEWLAPDFWLRRLHPEDRDRAEASRRARALCGGEQALHYRLVATDGRVVRVRDEAVPPEQGQDDQALMGFLFDETERHTLQHQVNRREQRQTLLEAMIRTGTWEWCPETDHFVATQETQRIFGFPPQDLLDAYLDRVVDQQRARVSSALRLVATTGRPFGLQHEIVLPDGTHRTLRMSAQREGSFVLGTWQDVSDRQMVDRAMAALARPPSDDTIPDLLRAAARDIAAHYGASFALIGLTNPSHTHVTTQAVWAGDHFADNFTYELEGTPCADILDASKEFIPQAAADLYPDDPMLVEMGVESYFGAPLLDSRGRKIGLMSVMSSRPMAITPWSAPVLGMYASRVASELERHFEQREAEQERERLHRQLAQSRRLEAIGRLAGGVAHDFNNLLTVVLGNCDLLMHMEQPPIVSEQLSEIQDAALRARELTRQLLAVGRRQVLRPRSIDLAQLIEKMRPILERLLGPHGRLIIRRHGVVSFVHGDPTQLEQVVLNLVTNAQQSMPDGGVVTISLRDGDNDDVVFDVQDTGVGVDEDLLPHLFEPFFTTRDEGTGLGLATVHGIVSQSGGSIEVHSEVNAGTTFRIRLPRSPEPVAKGAGLA